MYFFARMRSPVFFFELWKIHQAVWSNSPWNEPVAAIHPGVGGLKQRVVRHHRRIFFFFFRRNPWWSLMFSDSRWTKSRLPTVGLKGSVLSTLYGLKRQRSGVGRRQKGIHSIYNIQGLALLAPASQRGICTLQGLGLGIDMNRRTSNRLGSRATWWRRLCASWTTPMRSSAKARCSLKRFLKRNKAGCVHSTGVTVDGSAFGA